MSVISSLNRMCQEAKLPHDTLRTVAVSGITSFAITAVMSGNIRIGCLFGSLAALSSLVHAATRPVFKKLLDDKPTIKWYEEAVMMVVNLAITQTLINSLTSYRVNLIASSVLTVFISVVITRIINEKKDYSWEKGTVFILI